MKKSFLWCVMAAAFLSACDGRQGGAVQHDVDGGALDSLLSVPDSLFPCANQPMSLPGGVDGLFNDFVFEFDRMGELCAGRVKFPLLQVHDGDSMWCTRDRWRYEPMFVYQDFYTVFYNDESQMELAKDTGLLCVDVDVFDLRDLRVRTSHFERLESGWMLTEECLRPFASSDPVERFLAFYRQFATDSLVQIQSIAHPLHYATSDPDSDYGTIEGTLDAEQWGVFKPQLPDRSVTNIRYGQTYRNSSSMVMVMSGISNGMMDILSFAKRNGKWNLVSYEN